MRNYKRDISVQPHDTVLERVERAKWGSPPRKAVARRGVHEVVERHFEMLVMPKVAHAGLQSWSPRELWTSQQGLTQKQSAGGMSREQTWPDCSEYLARSFSQHASKSIWYRIPRMRWQNPAHLTLQGSSVFQFLHTASKAVSRSLKHAARRQCDDGRWSLPSREKSCINSTTLVQKINHP